MVKIKLLYECLTVLSFIFAVGCVQECILPEHPANGKHVPFDSNCPSSRSHTPACRSAPGSPVPDGWFLFTKCNPGFILDNDENGHSQSTCADGRWLPALPSCVYSLGLESDRHKCVAPPYPQNGKYEALPTECALNNKTSSDLLLPGAHVPSSCVLLYSCHSGYTLSDDDVISICDKGKWNPKTITCSGGGSNSIVIKTGPGRGGCPVPSRSDNRRFCSFKCQKCNSRCTLMYGPGSTFTSDIMRVECDYGYSLAGNQASPFVPCNNGNWDFELPRCLKLCPPLKSDSLHIQCMDGTSLVDCNEYMQHNTTATFKCQPSHSEYPWLEEEYSRTLVCTHSGEWSHLLPACKPACGVSKESSKIIPTIVNGKDSPLGLAPWHAGLYRHEDKLGTWSCICGGSLISNRVVLSAAHCVKALSPNQLRIALGKYYRSWNNELDESAVKCSVADIGIPWQYSGSQSSYAFDISLIYLSKSVHVNNFVMPVCLDLNLKINPNQIGHVVGWGKTRENGEVSETLLRNNISIVDQQTCNRNIPSGISAFEKLCGPKGSVSVVQQGDSGGGVTTVVKNLHFIIGLVSVKYNSLAVFTNISYHKQWVRSEMIRFNRIN